MMTEKTMYHLEDFNSIMNNGFNYVLDEETIQIISRIAKQVGSPDYVKTPVFKKKEEVSRFANINTNSTAVSNPTQRKMLSPPTKVENKSILDIQIDVIRSLLNKITDKNYVDMRSKITDTIDKLIIDHMSDLDMTRVSLIIFEIASTNRFFSKMYADLYSDLITKYPVMGVAFEDSIAAFIGLFDKIEYVDPATDYDMFCKINKDNEKRKSLSAFFLNLMMNGIIDKKRIVDITRNLVNQLYQFISEDNKKNEVDELTENIAILYKPSLYNVEYEEIGGLTICQVVRKLSGSKVKDYKSLTNKTIFKFMDLVDL
jgi:hypothetical protein